MAKGKRNLLVKTIDYLKSALGMNSDSSYSSFQENFYLSALNCRHTSQQGSTGNDIQNILGSTLKFIVPNVTTQNQTIRFYFTINSSTDETIGFYLTDWNSQPLAAPFTIDTDHTSIVNTMNTFMSTAGGVLTTGGQSFSFDTPIVTTTNSGYVDLTITTVMGRSWNVSYYFVFYDLTYISETGLLNTGNVFSSSGGVTGIVQLDNGSGFIELFANSTGIFTGDTITDNINNHSFVASSVFSLTVNTNATNYYSKIINEAIDVSITGTPINIGSYDVLGLLWSFWSPQVNTPAQFIGATSISNVVDNGAGLIQIQTNDFSSVPANGEAVLITGMITTSGIINGYWIIANVLNVFGVLTFDLLGSNFSALSGIDFSGGLVTRYPFGYGLIVGRQKSQNDQSYFGATVLRSKELDFRVPYQIDVDCDLTDKYELYFTDNKNVPRVFYYTGTLMLDGAINAIDPQGVYSYGSIDLSTRLIIAQPEIKLTFTGQLQTGGNTPAGNHLAAVRLVTRAGKTPTLWMALDNPVPVYSQPFNSSVSEYVYGSTPLDFTQKINQYQVQGIDLSIYQYLDLADIVYSDSAASGIIVTRYVITGAIMNIQYTGYENDTTPLDITTIGQIQANYVTAKNIRILDNYLVLSNLTTSVQYDITKWASSINYTLFKQPLDSEPNPAGLSQGFFQPEYADPNNVNKFVGYMINETYRFGVQVRWKETGAWSETYLVDDVKFDTIGNSRKTALSDFSITNELVVATSGINDGAGACQVLVPAIEFKYSTQYILSDGVNLGDIIDGIRFVRAECIPEVMASGLAVQCIFGVVTLAGGSGGYPSYGYSNEDIATQYYGEYPHWTGNESPNPNFPNIYSTGNPYTQDAVSKKLCTFYSPDILLGNVSFDNANGDQLIILNNTLSARASTNNYTISGIPFTSGFRYFDNADALDSGSSVVYSIDESAFINTGATGGIGGAVFSKYIYTQAQSDPTQPDTVTWNVWGTPVFHVTANILPNSGGYGVLYGQWFRVKVNKYGNSNSTVYISTGHERELSSTDRGILTDNVFGGDTFTQHLYIKQMYPTKAVIGNGTQAGGNGVAKFYCQNRVNSQLILPTGVSGFSAIFPGSFEDPQSPGNPFPNNDSNFNAKEAIFSSHDYYSDLNYTTSYNIQNNVVTYVAFDPLAEQITQYLSRVAWSDLKPQGSLTDLFRVLPPLNFHDLESKYGGINHMEVLNGELLTLQIRKWMRQYFNARGTLQVKDVGEVVIGDGEVMSRDGVQLSQIGTRHKWSCVKGIDPAGKDTEYWWSADYKKLMRFAADGTKCISDANFMQSFFANNTQYVFNFDTPALNYGICSVFDDRNNELVITFMGQKQAVPLQGATQANKLYLYSSAYNFPKNAVTKYTPSIFSTYEKTGEFYVSLQNNNHNHQPDISPTWWQIIPHQDALPFPVPLPNGQYPHDYYSEFTMSFGEKRNTFHSLYTPKPKSYLKYLDTYLAPDPINQGSVYEFNSGYDTNNWCKWFSGNNQDGNIYFVFSRPSNASKMFDALEFNSLISPARVDQWTSQHQTFMLAQDFLDINGQYATATRNDILTSATGSNEDDTSKLWGSYTIIKVTLSQGIFQKISNSIIKWVAIARDFRS